MSRFPRSLRSYRVSDVSSTHSLSSLPCQRRNLFSRTFVALVLPLAGGRRTPRQPESSARSVAPIDRAKNRTGFPRARGIVGNVRNVGRGRVLGGARDGGAINVASSLSRVSNHPRERIGGTSWKRTRVPRERKMGIFLVPERTTLACGIARRRRRRGPLPPA